jgi:RecA-family ATPase
MNEMEEIAIKTGAAVVFAAHFSKGNQAAKSSIDRISGSGCFCKKS